MVKKDTSPVNAPAVEELVVTEAEPVTNVARKAILPRSAPLVEEEPLLEDSVEHLAADLVVGLEDRPVVVVDLGARPAV